MGPYRWFEHGEGDDIVEAPLDLDGDPGAEVGRLILRVKVGLQSGPNRGGHGQHLGALGNLDDNSAKEGLKFGGQCFPLSQALTISGRNLLNNAFTQPRRPNRLGTLTGH